jgi:hypothetical protein
LPDEPLKSAQLVGRPANLALVVVDDNDAISGPFAREGVVGIVRGRNLELRA